MAGVDAEMRRDARACLQAAVAAVEPRALVAAELAAGPMPAASVQLVAIGKAAAAMTAGARDALGERLAGGVVIVPEALVRQVPAGFEAHGGGHPVPSEAGLRGAEAVQRLAESLGPDDTLLVLISGGGSALMSLPPAAISLSDVRQTTRLMLRAGATIGQLNATRKHLDQLKGGRLARTASPARVLALMLSDVVGDRPEVIASGPVSPDPTSFEDVCRMLGGLGLWSRLPGSVRRHLEAGRQGAVAESPGPGDSCFSRVETRIVGNNRLAAEAALAEASNRGYRPCLLTTSLTGEARAAGSFLAAIAREVRTSNHPVGAPACLLAAGETTVIVEGDGKGGRNQEVALGAAAGLDGQIGLLIAGFGTDGIDGPTDAAGAFADGSTLARAAAAGLDAEDHLQRNDAYRFFDLLGDLILTGPTGTNVMDLCLILVR